MKYIVIVTFGNGGTTGFTVKAQNLTEAWNKALNTFAPEHIRKVEITENILLAREG